MEKKQELIQWQRFLLGRALRKRGELDNLPKLVEYADKLEQACISTLDAGIMTKDLVALSENKDTKAVYTDEFIAEIKSRLEKSLA